MVMIWVFMISLNCSSRRIFKIRNHKLSRKSSYILQMFSICSLYKSSLKAILWFLIWNKRRFDQLSEIMKTHIITILVYLHNTTLQTSRGPLSDALVRIQLRPIFFPQLCVKVSKLWLKILNIFWKSRDLIFSVSGSFLM